MEIDSLSIDWCNHSTRRPKFEIVLKNNWPKLDNFVFERHVLSERRLAFKGTYKEYCVFFMQDLDFQNDIYEKPLTFNMKDGSIGFVYRPWRWHAQEMNEFFDEPAMDLYVTNNEFVSRHCSVTLEGAKILAAKAKVDLAFIYTRQFGKRKVLTTIEPIQKAASDTGTDKNMYWEKIKI